MIIPLAVILGAAVALAGAAGPTAPSARPLPPQPPHAVVRADASVPVAPSGYPRSWSTPSERTVAGMDASEPVASSAGLWAWPLPPPHAVVRPFVAPPNPYGAGHRGVDLRGATGSVVRAPADGVVHFAGFVVDRPVISLAHAGGILSSFEPVTAVVARGDPVRRGQVIGMLLPGHCAGSTCLHLGARVDGEYVNPLLFLGGVPRAVLLPVRGYAARGSGAPGSEVLAARWTGGLGGRAVSVADVLTTRGSPVSGARM